MPVSDAVEPITASRMHIDADSVDRRQWLHHVACFSVRELIRDPLV
jgi:hypothetical protein